MAKWKYWFKKEYAIDVSVQCIFWNSCEQNSYQCSKQETSAVHLATGFSNIPMCVWLVPAPSPATIPGSYVSPEWMWRKSYVGKWWKNFGKTWTEISPWRTSPCSLLKQIQWSQHDSYESTGWQSIMMNPKTILCLGFCHAQVIICLSWGSNYSGINYTLC